MDTKTSLQPGLDASKMAYLLLSLISIVVILIYTEEYVIPFIIATLIWFIIHETREQLQKNSFRQKEHPCLGSKSNFISVYLRIHFRDY